MQGDPNGPVAGLGGIVVEDNDVACVGGYAAGINTLVNRDYKDASGSWGPISANQAQRQYQAVLYRRNQYSGSLLFSVPRAATLGESANVWHWNDRAAVDLAKWRALGHDSPPGGKK